MKIFTNLIMVVIAIVFSPLFLALIILEWLFGDDPRSHYNGYAWVYYNEWKN